MATYQLEIRIDTGYLKRFAERGMKLCFSTSVSTGRDRTFKNVVACAKTLAPELTIQWTDEWQISATNDDIRDGGRLTSNTKVLNVDLGDKIVVNKLWQISKAATGDAKRANSFVFKNDGVEAGAILFRKIEDKFTPVYYSHAGRIFKDSGEILTPKQVVWVWMSDQYEADSMIDDYENLGPVMEIDMAGKTKEAVEFTKDAT